jgi:Ca2+-binding EF-hand superfamily protein
VISYELLISSPILSVAQLDHIYSLFNHFNHDAKDNIISSEHYNSSLLSSVKLSKMKFLTSLCTEYFNDFNTEFHDRLFAVVDYKSHSSYLDWDEFVCFVYILYYSSLDERLQFVFNLFDIAAAGKISKKYFKRVSACLMHNNSNNDPINSLTSMLDHYVSNVYTLYDANNDHYLNEKEFRRFAEGDLSITKLLKSLIINGSNTLINGVLNYTDVKDVDYSYYDKCMKQFSDEAKSHINQNNNNANNASIDTSHAPL